MIGLPPTRSALLEVVSRFPGIRFGELRARTGLANGTLSYHLGVLEKTGMLRVDRGPRFTGFYPSHFSAEDSKLFTAMRQDRARQILSFLLKAGQAGHGEITSHLGAAPSTASWHLAKLSKLGVIYGEAMGRETIYGIVESGRVSRLLALCQSTWRDNLVRRFTSAWEDFSI